MRRLGAFGKRAVRASLPLVVLASLLNAAPALAAVDYDTILRTRLDSVRERLDRRQAHRSMLTDKVDRFAQRLDHLQAEREAALTALSDQQDHALALERELDRLVPRLTPRLNRLDQFRKEGARAIAGLARMERSANLEDRTRSRLMATQAISIEQMRRASTAVRLLRRIPNAVTVRHRDVDFQIPLLAAAASRLDLRQSQLQRRRDSAIRDLADLSIEIDRLTAEEHRLARNVLARDLEATNGVGAGSDGLKRVLPNHQGVGKATVAGARVRGIALRQTQLMPVARPRDQAFASTRHAKASRVEKNAAVSAKNRTSALLSGWASKMKPRAADVGSLETPMVSSSLMARVEPGRIEGDQPPLIPMIETIGYTAAGGKRSGDDLKIEIAARPRQLVAAPNDGRVAFAGDFRSYGLLLIIEHGNGYHTLLWGFSLLDIELGDAVRAGQIIGVVKDGPSPKLHVELRRNGQPVSPEVWLAASSSGVKG